MLFTSLPFVLFLAATLLLYYIIPKKLQWGFLLVASYVFYALADLRYLIFIMTTTVTVWYVAKRVEAINLEQKAYIKAHKGELSKEDKAIYKARVKRRRWHWLLLAVHWHLKTKNAM